MDINLKINNIEDIEYVNKYSPDKKDDLLRTAITIGLKSISLSEVNMNCNSYFEPIKQIVERANELNTNKIVEIDD
jgi:hypothetical protein